MARACKAAASARTWAAEPPDEANNFWKINAVAPPAPHNTVKRRSDTKQSKMNKIFANAVHQPMWSPSSRIRRNSPTHSTSWTGDETPADEGPMGQNAASTAPNTEATINEAGEATWGALMQ